MQVKINKWIFSEYITVNILESFHLLTLLGASISYDWNYMMNKEQSFWTTLPGILTGIAALITAMTGLYLALNTESGIEKNKQVVVQSNTQTTSSVYPAEKGVLYRNTPWLGLELWQGGESVDFRSSDKNWSQFTAKIKRKPFELRFTRTADDLSIGILAWQDDSVYEFISNKTFHIPGTGIAGAQFGIPMLYIANDGFNYYNNERMKKLSDNKYAVYVSALASGDINISLERYTGPLFLIIFRVPKKSMDVAHHDYEVIELHIQ
ncbi:MAG: hypothetical protein D3918_10240 [Candidatus Electrothrix sp. AX2]|nr:hypothetical protein [Candidatus Electrothrix gigas]